VIFVSSMSVQVSNLNESKKASRWWTTLELWSFDRKTRYYKGCCVY